MTSILARAEEFSRRLTDAAIVHAYEPASSPEEGYEFYCNTVSDKTFMVLVGRDNFEVFNTNGTLVAKCTLYSMAVSVTMNVVIAP